MPAADHHPEPARPLNSVNDNLHVGLGAPVATIDSYGHAARV